LSNRYGCSGVRGQIKFIVHLMPNGDRGNDDFLFAFSEAAAS
jgi:hypothetical protein